MPRERRSTVPALLLLFCVAGAYGDGRTQSGQRAGGGGLSSTSGEHQDSPPRYRPDSQAYVVGQALEMPPAPLRRHERVEGAGEVSHANCLRCEASRRPGPCRAAPSCVYCESTVSALCDGAPPCQRCSVIKNPLFVCTPGEKYMDECDSCRCTDGHAGRCTHIFCENRLLHHYAMQLSSGGELY